MLLDQLYKINNVEQVENKISATVVINPSHEIFGGHFPTQPVLPGVCLVEMLKDILKLALDKKVKLSEAANIKYPKMVDPQQNSELRFELTFDKLDEAIRVSATSFLEDDSANFKFKGIFIL